ncbi:glycosyltransferase family 4 protein [Rhodoligotrophos defluvii]|uniref:glycosyltransferase family 4 protein n=1 Tax=Rhodoligotrophos defluvii TaxID=2561934 RepID=UPI0010C96139|nr:glycosyltransferase family 4 protein [Rhodoligotrophos defluvii]
MLQRLRVIHVLRAPIGGLFRHVCDLASGQAARGLNVGVICDTTTSPAIEKKLAELERVCTLGVHRVPMTRLPSLSDKAAVDAVQRIAEQTGATILHGHGAKGGAYARLAATKLPAKGPQPARSVHSVYTPHGGSLHYSRLSIAGALFLTMEQVLLSRTDQFVFVCEYERDTFIRKIGKPSASTIIAYNGVTKDEIAPVAPAEDAADLLFIGELRHLKGVDLLLRAMAALSDQRPELTACIVGHGPDAAAFKALAHQLGLASRVSFPGAMPARQAFARGRLLVVPSRAESLPYIVLEAMAASVPLIAARVGGIPEILDGHEDLMVPPDAVDPLAAAIDDALADLDSRRELAQRLTGRIAEQFSVSTMVDRITRSYLTLPGNVTVPEAEMYAHPFAAE